MFAKKVPHEDFNHFQFKIEIDEGNSNIYKLSQILTEFILERRRKESEKIRAKYDDDRVPVIIEKASSDQILPDLEQTKY